MHHYNVWQLAIALRTLREMEVSGKVFGDTLVAQEMSSKAHVPLLEYVRQQCESLELQSALHRCDKFVNKIRENAPWSEIGNQATVLREAIEGELCYRRFAFVPVSKAAIHDNAARDWADIWTKFPSSKEDAQRAVDCYALEQDTACVFHLMRVAEYGLRALARERKVRLPKNRPLEWAEWNDLIVAIGKKVDAIANRKRGPKRAAALEFYRGALGEFQAFKDAYRNHVMHTRGAYDEHQAASVLSHVRDFMSRLATKTEEIPTECIKW
jgi:hypothetical protein